MRSRVNENKIRAQQDNCPLHSRVLVSEKQNMEQGKQKAGYPNGTAERSRFREELYSTAPFKISVRFFAPSRALSLVTVATHRNAIGWCKKTSREKRSHRKYIRKQAVTTTRIVCASNNLQIQQQTYRQPQFDV